MICDIIIQHICAIQSKLHIYYCQLVGIVKACYIFHVGIIYKCFTLMICSDWFICLWKMIESHDYQDSIYWLLRCGLGRKCPPEIEAFGCTLIYTHTCILYRVTPGQSILSNSNCTCPSPLPKPLMPLLGVHYTINWHPPYISVHLSQNGVRHVNNWHLPHNCVHPS